MQIKLFMLFVSRFSIFSCACWVALMFCSIPDMAQPAAGFNVQATACLGEALEFQNTSTAADTYIWEFCHEDLEAEPVVSQVSTLPATGSIFYGAVRVVESDGKWYGFATDINGRKLLRLNFNTDLTSNPGVDNLGDLGGLLTSPGAIDVIQQGGSWYIFILNIFQNKVARLTMGNGLQSAPTGSQDLGNLGAPLSTPIGIKALFTGTNCVLFISNLGTNKISLIDMGASFSGAPAGNQLLADALLSEPCGIDVIRQGSNWYGVLSSFSSSGKVLLLSFGTDVFNAPSYTNLGVVPNGRETRLDQEGTKYTAFIRSQNNGLYQVKFGTDFSAPVLSRINTNQLQNDSRSIEIVKDTPVWRGYTIEANTGVLLRLDFSGDCGVEMSMNDSNEEEPEGLEYQTAGDYYIELTAFDQDHKADITSQSIAITSNVAPEGTILSDPGQCTGVPKTFQVSTTNSLVSYLWDFGDSGSDIIHPTSHTYITPGTYEVSVHVVDQNTCNNVFKIPLKIYDPPVALFDLPAGLVCTNNEFTFANNTVDNFDGLLTYQWLVDSDPVGSTRDLIYSFITAGNQDVKLITAIPGCSDELTQTVNGILDGPTVDFSITGKCEDDLIQFTNNSSGNIVGFLWDFGDDNTSTQISEVHQYDNIGLYAITLFANATNGCQNQKTENLNIYSNPQTDFSLDLPPFSCSGTPSQFNDLTPNPTDSNLTSWQWSFGDAASGSSTQRNPAYTYGNSGPYTVSLLVSTNFGCTASIQKSVQISQTPLSNFTWGPSCLNQPTAFTSVPDPSIQTWTWNMGATTHSTANPVHTFTSTGPSTVKLTTAGLNGCIGTTSKTLTVPVPPTLNFSIENACSGKESVFKDATATSADPVTSWSWDFAGKGGASGTPAVFLFSDPGVYSVKMSTVHTSGCGYSVTKNTTIHQSPVAKFSTQPESGPPPLEVQFTNQSANAVTSLWKFGDQNNSTSVLASPAFTYLSLGVYGPELTVTSAQGCQDSFSKEVHVINPYADVAMESLTVYKNESTLELYPVLSVRNYSNFKVTTLDVWLDVSGGGVVKETVTTSLLPGSSQLIVLSTGVVPRGGETYLCTQLKLTGDAKPENDKDCFSLQGKDVILAPYPNPAKGELSMDWIAEQEGPVQFTVFNATGQTAFHQELTGIRKGLNQLRIDISHLSPGIYLIRFDDGRVKKSYRQVLN